MCITRVLLGLTDLRRLGTPQMGAEKDLLEVGRGYMASGSVHNTTLRRVGSHKL